MSRDNRTFFAVLLVEQLAAYARVPNRDAEPQSKYRWPESIDDMMRVVGHIMREQPINVPLHVMGVLPSWLLALLTLMGDWTEVWCCHGEDGSPWLHVIEPGTDGAELPTITGVTWARPTDPLHRWQQSQVTMDSGLGLTGTRLLRQQLANPREQHAMNTAIPPLQPKNGVLFLSPHEWDSGVVPQAQALIMAARAAVAYSMPGTHQATLVAVECTPGCYVVVHSMHDDYNVGEVLKQAKNA